MVRGVWWVGMWVGCAQEDAHDFFYQMLDAMHTISLKEAGGERRHDATTQETTLVYHTFGGYTRSQVCERSIPTSPSRSRPSYPQCYGWSES